MPATARNRKPWRPESWVTQNVTTTQYSARGSPSGGRDYLGAILNQEIQPRGRPHSCRASTAESVLKGRRTVDPRPAVEGHRAAPIPIRLVASRESRVGDPAVCSLAGRHSVRSPGPVPSVSRLESGSSLFRRKEPPGSNSGNRYASLRPRDPTRNAGIQEPSKHRLQWKRFCLISCPGSLSSRATAFRVGRDRPSSLP